LWKDRRVGRKGGSKLPGEEGFTGGGAPRFAKPNPQEEREVQEGALGHLGKEKKPNS